MVSAVSVRLNARNATIARTDLGISEDVYAGDATIPSAAANPRTGSEPFYGTGGAVSPV